MDLISSLLLKAAQLSYRLITITLFIRYVSESNYAEWIKLSSAASIAGTLDLGFGSIIAARVLRETDFKRKSEIYSSYVFIVISLIIVTVILGVTISYLMKDSLIVFVTLLLTLSVEAQMLLNTLMTEYKISNQLYKSNYLSFLRIVLELVLVAATLYLLGYSPIVLSTVILSSSIVAIVLVILITMPRGQNIAIIYKVPLKSDLIQAFKSGGAFQMANLSTVLLGAGAQLVTAFYLPPNLVVQFTIIRTTTRTFSQFYDLLYQILSNKLFFLRSKKKLNMYRYLVNQWVVVQFAFTIIVFPIIFNKYMLAKLFGSTMDKVTFTITLFLYISAITQSTVAPFVSELIWDSKLLRYAKMQLFGCVFIMISMYSAIQFGLSLPAIFFLFMLLDFVTFLWMYENTSLRFFRFNNTWKSKAIKFSIGNYNA
jgi:O-antigen/teichoic acid export membrane protein